MAYNAKLTKRVRDILAGTRRVTERRMFSGAGFMVDGKLCVSVGDDRVMLRVDPNLHDELVAKKGCRPVIMKGREYKGYVLVQRGRIAHEKRP
jgi:TfoX/Sxy family transcriptional regulator of competence genes